MNLQTSLASSLLARLMPADRRSSPSLPQPEPADFDAALFEYTHQNYANAYNALARLADGGHVPAARMALLMVNHGTRLYGHHFNVSAASRLRWADLTTVAQEAP